MKKKFLFLALILSFIIFFLIKNSSIVVGRTAYFLIETKAKMGSAKSISTTNKEFYAQGKDENVYAGTLAKISSDGKVAVWTQEGLKTFQSDKYTIYSYFDVCQAYRNNPQQMEVNDQVRTVTTSIDNAFLAKPKYDVSKSHQSFAFDECLS